MSVRHVLLACSLAAACGAGEWPQADARAQGPGQPKLVPSGTPYRLGLVDSRTIDLRSGGPGPSLAVEVLGVWPGSPAAVAGLEAGDVILAADGRRTHSPDELRAALASSEGNLRLTIIDVRTGFATPVVVRLIPAWPAPWPQPPPNPRPTTVVGQLRSVPAVGPAAGRYQVIDRSGWTWTLDFSRRPELERIAARLEGRQVLAVGIGRQRPGPSIPESRTLILTELRPARWGGPQGETRDRPKGSEPQRNPRAGTNDL